MLLETLNLSGNTELTKIGHKSLEEFCLIKAGLDSNMFLVFFRQGGSVTCAVFPKALPVMVDIEKKQKLMQEFKLKGRINRAENRIWPIATKSR